MDNIDKGLKQIRWVVVHWINISRYGDKWGRGVVNIATCPIVLQSTRNSFTGRRPISSSRTNVPFAFRWLEMVAAETRSLSLWDLFMYFVFHYSTPIWEKKMCVHSCASVDVTKYIIVTGAY